MSTSTRYLRAIQDGRAVVRKAKHVGSDVLIVFRPALDRRHQPQTLPPISLRTYEALDLLAIEGVTLDQIRNSNLGDLVARGLVEI